MAFTETGVGKYLLASEALALPDSDGAAVTSVASSTIAYDLSNKKFLVTLLVTEVCAGDGALDIKVQGSYDGTTWTDIDASLSIDVDPTGLNTATAWADTTGYYAPYYRFLVFSDGTDTQDEAAVLLTYSTRVH